MWKTETIGEVRMATISFKCPNCGGDLVFDPSTGKYKCEFCLSLFTQAELEQLEADRAEDTVVQQKDPAAACSDETGYLQTVKMKLVLPIVQTDMPRIMEAVIMTEKLFSVQVRETVLRMKIPTMQKMQYCTPVRAVVPKSLQIRQHHPCFAFTVIIRWCFQESWKAASNRIKSFRLLLAGKMHSSVFWIL